MNSSIMIENFRDSKGIIKTKSSFFKGQLHEFALLTGSVDDLLQTADVAFLLLSDLDNCGRAYYNTRSWPIGISQTACAKGYYSFGHEIGHMLGARHNRGGSTSDYDYGYGWLIESPGAPDNGGYRTVMA